MSRSQLFAILAVVAAIAVLLFIFTATGGPEEVEDLDAPAGEAAGATSIEPAGEGD